MNRVQLVGHPDNDRRMRIGYSRRLGLCHVKSVPLLAHGPISNWQVCAVFRLFAFHRARPASLSERLQLKCDPCWSMIARVVLATHPPVYTAVHESLRHFRQAQEMIESHALVGGPPLALIIPERSERPLWAQLPRAYDAGKVPRV